jgi:hypothetical protein
MRLAMILTAATAVFWATSECAIAGIVNGGFETGNTSGWQSLANGNATVQATGPGTAPGGLYFGHQESQVTVEGYPSMQPPGETWLYQDFSANAGDTLSFMYNASVSAHGYGDGGPTPPPPGSPLIMEAYATALLHLLPFSNGPDTVLAILGVLSSQDFTSSDSTNGWLQQTYVMPNTGAYRLYIETQTGVLQFGEGYVGPTPYAHSYASLDVDNVQLTPEPATLSLLALGGLAVLRRKRR